MKHSFSEDTAQLRPDINKMSFINKASYESS